MDERFTTQFIILVFCFGVVAGLALGWIIQAI